MILPDLDREWLEADGLGGFASGTVPGARTRRYHALLLAASNPPAGRFVLVNGVEAWIDTPAGPRALSSQIYGPGVVFPDGASRLERFEVEPWPKWTFRLDDGSRVEHEIFVPHGASAVVLSWRGPAGRLTVRPLISGRDPHSLHHENGSFRFDAEPAGESAVRFRPYDGVPAVRAAANGPFTPGPEWYRNFEYVEERSRGLDSTEDLASPGTFTFDLAAGEAFLVLSVDGEPVEAPQELRARERARRAAFATPLDRAADAYLVRRGQGKTIIAGYPWFGDWGRDTFIALRGLCLATGRLDDAGAILVEWASAVSQGMLPNRFPDRGDLPEYNSVDASLWYVVAVHEWLAGMTSAGRRVPPAMRDALRAAVSAIVDGYAAGTRYGIRRDADGLITSGEPGVQLTWMDAKVGDWVVTPRTGKPVEIQALWYNALRAASSFRPELAAEADRVKRAFADRFWNESAGCLYDVVDADHVAGRDDASIRPNQLFAVGGLPFSLLEGDRARAVVEVAERRLLTPLGPRSLAPGSPGYASHYRGGVVERDGAYHQGTVWPWLIGPFVEAWLAVRGRTADARAEARSRFLRPLEDHLEDAGLGHVSEVADAEPPHTPGGCPFQAWSVGELIRVRRMTDPA